MRVLEDAKTVESHMESGIIQNKKIILRWDKLYEWLFLMYLHVVWFWYEMKIEAVKNMLKERIWEGML